MITIVGRPVGLWGVLAAVCGTAVIVPSAIALILTLIAIAARLF